MQLEGPMGNLLSIQVCVISNYASIRSIWTLCCPSSFWDLRSEVCEWGLFYASKPVDGARFIVLCGLMLRTLQNLKNSQRYSPQGHERKFRQEIRVWLILNMYNQIYLTFLFYSS